MSQKSKEKEKREQENKKERMKERKKERLHLNANLLTQGITLYTQGGTSN